MRPYTLSALMAGFLSITGLCQSSLAQQVVTQPPTLAQQTVEGVKLHVQGQSVLLELLPEFKGQSVEIPRLAAPLRSLTWRDTGTDATLKLQPELKSWKIIWDKIPQSRTIVLEVDAPPRLLHECPPIAAAGDGSLWLPAHLALTEGDKIRYEPQTFKNTVGYWAGMNNSASWTLAIDRPGKFNVEILQGCGAGNGGSLAKIELLELSNTDSEANEQAIAAVEFEVQETGHFQNFLWRHLGEIQLAQAGQYRLKITPLSIKRAALMDVRAVHLVRLP